MQRSLTLLFALALLAGAIAQTKSELFSEIGSFDDAILVQGETYEKVDPFTLSQVLDRSGDLRIIFTDWDDKRALDLRREGTRFTLRKENAEPLELSRSEVEGLLKSLGEERRLKMCVSNLKNLGTALEMYCTDWSGRYPTGFEYVTPNYLRTIPTCPSAGTDTYSATYEMGTEPDSYRFSCKGKHHAHQDYPRYDSVQGCTLKP